MKKKNRRKNIQRKLLATINFKTFQFIILIPKQQKVFLCNFSNTLFDQKFGHPPLLALENVQTPLEKIQTKAEKFLK